MNPKPDGLQFVEVDLAGIEDFWGWAYELDQYMRLSAEFKQWLAERGEAE